MRYIDCLLLVQKFLIPFILLQNHSPGIANEFDNIFDSTFLHAAVLTAGHNFWFTVQIIKTISS
jgi:hypothetical protein